MVLPGGFLAWDSNWPAADRGRMIDDGISRFLTEWLSIKK
jgi:hypothetical protein